MEQEINRIPKTIRLEEWLHESLRKYAFDNRTSFQAVTEDALKEFLKSKERGQAGTESYSVEPDLLDIGQLTDREKDLVRRCMAALRANSNPGLIVALEKILLALVPDAPSQTHQTRRAQAR